MIDVLKGLDFDRERPTNLTDLYAIEVLNQITSEILSVSSNGLATLLKIDKATLKSWEENHLIFPTKDKATNRRKYVTKDILRGYTIKYLMSNLGFRRFSGVKLVLELANRLVEEENRTNSLDNIRIDRILHAALNYSLDEVVHMKLHGNSKRGLNDEQP